MRNNSVGGRADSLRSIIMKLADIVRATVGLKGVRPEEEPWLGRGLANRLQDLVVGEFVASFEGQGIEDDTTAMVRGQTACMSAG